MGCKQSLDIPLQKISLKRSMLIDISATESSFHSQASSFPLEKSSGISSQSKLALRTLIRYGNLTIFRSLYCTFKHWKKYNIQLFFNEYSEDSLIFIDKYELALFHRPSIDILAIEKILKTSLLHYQCAKKPSPNLLFIEVKEFKPDFKPNPEILIIKLFRISDSEINEIKKQYQKNSEVFSTIITEVMIRNQIVTPYPLKATLKLLEDLLDKKYLLDLKELKEYKKPRELSEFLIDYLNRGFGIQSVAQKTLSRLILTLEINKDHAYLKFFCRMLKIFHPRPIPLNLLTFLCQIRIEFNKAIEKSLEKATIHKEKYEKFAERGGNALLVHVFELIHKTFKKNSVKRLFFKNLCPDSLQFYEYIIFYYCYRLSKSGNCTNEQSKEKIFKNIIDSIDFQLNSDQIKQLRDYFESEDLKKIYFQISSFNSSTKNDKYSLSKLQFFEILLNVYNELKDKFILKLIQRYRQQEKMKLENFIFTVKGLDPNFNEFTLKRIFNEGILMQNQVEFLEESVFAYLLLYYNAGDLSDFRNNYLEPLRFQYAYIERRIDYADLCIKSEDAIDLRSPIIKMRTLKPSSTNIFEINNQRD